MILKRLVSICWSMLLTVPILPYQIFRVFVPARKPGRPGSHPISKVFTRTFESKKAKRFVGIGLTVFIMLFGVMGNILATNATQIADQTLIMVPDNQVITVVSLYQPLEGMIVQGFHGLHKGIDILAPLGAEIRPIAQGKVVEASLGRIGWGNTVVVKHERGLKSRYAHLRDIKVVEGQEIKQELVLGTVGMSGWTSGPHLHLEIYQNGRTIDPITVLPNFSL